MTNKTIYIRSRNATNLQYKFGVLDLIPNNGEILPKTQNLRKQNFNYSLLTEGEFEVMLMKEMLKINQAAYNDPKGIYQKGINLIDNRLALGLHRTPKSFTGYIPKELNKITRNLKRAISKTSEAGRVVVLRNDFRHSIGNGFDPESSPVLGTDCGLRPELGSPNFIANLNAWENCIRQNQEILQLNENFPDSGHYLLYAHDSNFQYSNNSLYIDKAQFHKLVLQTIAANTRLTEDILLTWSRYGVKLRNYNSDIIPMEPEEYLLNILTNGHNKDRKSISCKT